jgi:hypothetical protein
MTSNPFNYGAAQAKAEGERIVDEATMTIEEQLAYALGQLRELRHYRYVCRRLEQIAREGNLMINHPQQGFMLVEDLQEYMGEKL